MSVAHHQTTSTSSLTSGVQRLRYKRELADKFKAEWSWRKRALGILTSAPPQQVSAARRPSLLSRFFTPAATTAPNEDRRSIRRRADWMLLNWCDRLFEDWLFPPGYTLTDEQQVQSCHSERCI